MIKPENKVIFICIQIFLGYRTILVEYWITQHNILSGIAALEIWMKNWYMSYHIHTDSDIPSMAKYKQSRHRNDATLQNAVFGIETKYYIYTLNHLHIPAPKEAMLMGYSFHKSSIPFHKFQQRSYLISRIWYKVPEKGYLELPNHQKVITLSNFDKLYLFLRK